MPKILRILPAILLLGGCTTVGYYAQAVGGHLDILAKRRPIAELLQDETVPKPVRTKLGLAEEAREFAHTELGLPDNGSYRDYADLGRSYAVWNVVATPALSTAPVESCFLFVGCISYRGYFDRNDAESAAAELAEEGYDVYVGGATAYSTLGWFNDPLLNTLLTGSDERMLSTLFHELAHQKLYVKGAPAFNEAFAVAVAQEGVRRWYTARGQPESYRTYARALERRRQFYSLLVGVRRRLGEIYAEDRPRGDKLRAKNRIFKEMKTEYGRLKEQWGGYAGFDDWMAQDLNNAHLALVATYHELVPAFQLLLAKEEARLDRFYAQAGAIGVLEAPERGARLDALLAELRPDGPVDRVAFEDKSGENLVN